MGKIIMPRPQMVEVILHVGFWIFMVVSPFMFWNTHERPFLFNDVMICLGIPCALSVCFYVNYLYLSPRLLTHRSGFNAFFVANLLLILTCVMCAQLWWNIWTPTMEEVEEVISSKKMMTPRWYFIVKDIVIFTLAVGVGTMLLMSKKWWSEVQARQKAELLNLRNQINPHFLLNTLNNIYALIAFNQEQAQHSVLELSKLLRYILYENSERFVALDKEIEFLRNYVELMRLRLTSGVEVRFQTHVPSDHTLRIAPLLFISLVENAFKHGINSAQRGFIDICIAADDTREYLTCTIVNSNFPKDSSDKSGNGIGLEQVQRRLDLLYPNAYKWKKRVEENGTVYRSVLQLKINV